MTGSSQNSRLNTIIKLLISVLTPSFIITVIATFFIWLFLYRIGRQDIFLEIISFKEIFYFISFYSILSTLMFCLVFFTPTLIPMLILQDKMRDYSEYELIKKGYVKALITSSLIAAGIFCAFSYYLTKEQASRAEWPVAIFFLLNALVCFLLNLKFNLKTASRRSSILSGWDWWKFVLSINFFKPIAFGFFSLSFVFPLGLLIKTLKFPEGTSDLKEALLVFGLTCFIIIFTLFPLIVFVELKANIWKRVMCFISTIFISLILLCSLLPIIPVMIMNNSMKLSGVMDLTTYRYAVPADQYPSEMFEETSWLLTESKDKKFHTFEGINLFSLGNVSLICPNDIPEMLNKSMDYQLGNKEFDDELREELHQSTKKCNVLNKENLLKWYK